MPTTCIGFANVVVVQKNDKWWVYIDFIYLNKACVKDNFPLPKIDMSVDVTILHELINFMDTYSRCKILMHQTD